ncbi:MAG: glutathione S-transferase family protein [Rhodospirillaceae bacterium]|jgi:glutathione S-transferase|nr:glutathione S-transferase family protein [Rhodospirillaceae bacterium]MBT4589201.1 glutathione S-transferase family protein [Rhodospirillaceae bacterium]MBT7267674.1 glutathione S-transferase family protein [Rhodospirillaceae bacterium]
MLELYHSGLTTCSKQIRLVLREKGLDYESRYIELWNYENLNKDYLKINEIGVVPTLVHDGVPIRNSFVIAEYIEDVFPEPSLLPSTALMRAKMRLWTWSADDIHLSATAVTYNANLQGMVNELSLEDKLVMLDATPVPDRRARWQKLADGGIDHLELDTALAKIKWGLERFDEALEEGPWVCADEYSLGDIMMLSIVHRTRELAPEIVSEAVCPRVVAWRERMMARPAVEWVYTPGTEETPKRPAGKSISGIK